MAATSGRTSWGAPDLTGTWSNLSLTKLERPDGVTALVLGDAEAASLQARLKGERFHPARDAVGQRDTEVWPDAHLARIDGKARSSWMTSPANGKLPYTAEGRRRFADAVKVDYDNPESRPPLEQCLTGAAAGPPILPGAYNANYKIVQSREAIAILSEMNTELRIIRLGAAHQSAALASALGDSVGHFEGETLVIETTGFARDTVTPWGGLVTAKAKVTERFTRVSATELRYRFTVEDPDAYSQVWSGEMPFLATKDQIYEFACHEGNYSMEAILAGARQDDARRAAGLATKQPG